MMKQKDKVSDTELHAFVDGKLPESEVARIRAWLAEHDADAARVRGWRQQNEAIVQYFDRQDLNLIPARLDPLRLQRKNRRRLLNMAAVWLVFFVGGSLGWFANERFTLHRYTSHQIAEPAIAAYRVYAAEVRHPVEVGADQQQHLANWLSKRLGSPLHIPELESEGFQLMGGRLLAVADGPAAQLMFENDAGKRVALFATRSLNSHDTAFQFTRSGSVNGFFWIDSSLGYAVVGEISRELLLRLSHLVYQQLNDNTSSSNQSAGNHSL